MFGVSLVDGFLCLLAIDGDSLDTISTRPFSVVTKEECQRSSISSVGLSPDSAVVFLVDQGLSSIIRWRLTLAIVDLLVMTFAVSKTL